MAAAAGRRGSRSLRARFRGVGDDWGYPPAGPGYPAAGGAAGLTTVHEAARRLRDHLKLQALGDVLLLIVGQLLGIRLWVPVLMANVCCMIVQRLDRVEEMRKLNPSVRGGVRESIDPKPTQ